MIKNLSPITLRDTMVLKISTAFSFTKVLLHTDLPYYFDLVNKYWWRWYADLYGFYYHRVKRTYSLWLTMALKKNIGVYMHFYMLTPNKRSKILEKWKRRAYLYKNSLINRITNNEYSKNFKYLNFEHSSNFWLSDIAKYILFPGNKSKRAIDSFGYYGKELDMFFSTYNYKWNNLYKSSSLFYNKGTRMPKNFMIVVNSYFTNSSFFINAFDSSLILYPQYFLEYYNKMYNSSILSVISFFDIKFNINLYINILCLLFKIYLHFIKYKFYKYVSLFIDNTKNNIEFNLYKLNLLYYFIFLNYYFIYNNLKNYNKWYLYSVYLNNYNLYNFFLFKDYKNLTNYNLLYNNFFNTFIKNYKKWINNKRLKNNYKWKYDYFFKFLLKLYLYNQYNIKNINKFLYIKKFYIFEVMYLWDVVNKKFLNYKNFNSQKIVKYVNKFMFNKYKKIKGCFYILNFLYSLKNKIFNKNLFFFNSYFFIKPSIKVSKKVSFISLIKWITNYGRLYIKVPEFLELKYNYKFSHYNIFGSKTNKISLFVRKSNKTMSNFKFFVNKFFNIIIFNFKINFGLSYNLITFFKNRNNITNMDNFYFINLQRIVCKFLLFLKTILDKLIYSKNFKNLLFIRKFNLYDKFFFSYIFYFRNSKIHFNKFKKFNNYKKKYIKFNNLNFISFS